MIPPLAISAGDPAGVGPAVTAAALTRCLGNDRALVYGDAGWMERALQRYGFEPFKRIDASAAGTLAAGEVGLVHVADWPITMVQARAPTIAGGGVQREALDAACDAAIAGIARAIVTGPVSKEAVSLSGVSFRGQTEHLARRAGVHVENVTMMFLGPRLKVALVATHWAIKRVPSTVTREHIERTVRHLTDALSRWMPEAKPLQLQVTSSVAGIVAPGHKLRRSTQVGHVPTPAAHQAYMDGLNAFHELGNLPAEELLEKAAEIDPDYLPPLSLLISVYDNEGKSDQADSLCGVIQGRYDQLPRELQLKSDQRCAWVRGDYWTALQRGRQLA